MGMNQTGLNLAKLNPQLIKGFGEASSKGGSAARELYSNFMADAAKESAMNGELDKSSQLGQTNVFLQSVDNYTESKGLNEANSHTFIQNFSNLGDYSWMDGNKDGMLAGDEVTGGLDKFYNLMTENA